jgi:hypothetical protein
MCVQTVSLGLCTRDGTVHLCYDQHDNPLNYRVSKPGLLDGAVPWSTESFGETKAMLPGLDAADCFQVGLLPLGLCLPT